MPLDCNKFYIDIIEQDKSPVCAYIVTAYDLEVELKVSTEVAEIIIGRMREAQDSVWHSIWRDAQHELSVLKEDPMIDLMNAANEAADPNPANGSGVGVCGTAAERQNP